MMMIQHILTTLKESKHILMSAHVSPDGDAIGALAGLARLCEFWNVTYTILLEEVPNKYKYLTEGLCVEKSFEEDYDTFVALDCGDIDRLGKFKPYFEQVNKTINVDHHYTNDDFGIYNYVEKDGSSTCELVFNLIEAAHMPLTKEVAVAIYTGIVFDTGGFMHPCTKASTHEVAAKLLAVPFDYSKLYHSLIHLRTKKTIALQTVVAEHMKWLGNNKVISYITQENLIYHHCTRQDVEGIVNYLKNIEYVDLAILIYPTNDVSYKVSFRSNEPYDVATLATTWGGGGHQRASGATLEGDLDTIMKKVEASVALLK